MGEKQEICIGLITFQTIAALLLQISKCRELSDFGLIFWPQKLRSRNSFFFYKYSVCLWCPKMFLTDNK